MRRTSQPSPSRRSLAACCLLFFAPLLLAVCLYPVVLSLAAGVDVSGNKTVCWIVGLVRQKISDAKAVKGPKVLFVGGSATHYGLRAEEFTRLTGLGAYNLGTNAGLGVAYQLEHAKAVLQPGDVAVLVPEFILYHGEILDEVFSKASFIMDPAFARSLPPDKYAANLRNIGPAHLAEGVWRRLTAGGQGPLCANAPGLTPRGDIERYFADAPMTESFNANLAGEKRNLSLWIDPGPADPARMPPAAAIAAFKTWCDQRAIIVLAAYPNVHLDREFIQSPAFRSFLANIEAMYARLGIAFIGNIDTAVYPREFFLDTHYHLGRAGAVQRTADFAPLFCAASGLCR